MQLDGESAAINTHLMQKCFGIEISDSRAVVMTKSESWRICLCICYPYYIIKTKITYRANTLQKN